MIILPPNSGLLIRKTSISVNTNERFWSLACYTMMSVFKSRLVRQVSLVLFICACQFLIILPVLCYRLPFSPYFKVVSPSKEYMRGRVNVLNKERLDYAHRYFTGQTSGQNLEYYDTVGNKSSLKLAVAIVTVNRSYGKKEYEGLGYVIQSASGVDAFAKSREFVSNTYVFVCNVDNKPNLHKDAMFLKSHLPFVERYGSSSFKMDQIQLPNNSVTYQQRTHTDKYEKETYDYAYCLKVAKLFNPEFILIVEDDAVPHKDLAVVLKYSLENHLVIRSNSGFQTRDFAYLKLYYPEKWQGFAYEAYRVLELFSIGYVGGGIYILFVYICLKTERTKNVVILGHFLFGVLFFILTAQLIGRQNVLELRRLSRYFYQFRSSPGCCTPAMLYPSAIVDRLTSFLTSARVDHSIHTDLAITEFVERSNTPAYQLVPNLFQHIGLHTSLKKGDNPPDLFM